MSLRKNLKLGVAGSVAAAALGVLFFGPGPAASGPDPFSKEVLDKAPRRQMPSGPNDVIVMGAWRNGKFHVIKLRTETEVIDGPAGSVESQSTTSYKDEVEAQLPPMDARFDGVEPTQAQIDEMQARVGAEQAKYRPRPPGAPDPARAGRP